MKVKNWGLLVGSVVICEAAGLVGAIFTTPAITTWYALLTKPSFNPPSWLFAPVWTILYLLMGIVLYQLCVSGFKKTETRIALEFFAAQLVINVLWSAIFFGQHQIASALVTIIVLWLAILLTMVYSAKINKSAVWLLLPYLAWVSFASALNYSIWLLNR